MNKVKRAHDAEIQAKIRPAKDVLRQKLLDELKASGLEKVEQMVQTEDGRLQEVTTT